MELIIYDQSYNPIIQTYQLTEDQLMFTGTPEESILKAEKDLERYPILALENDKLVTFFVLHINEGVKPYTNNEKAILIRAFSTDTREQGKGYASQSLQLLPLFIKSHFPGVNEIVLAVNVRNIAAQRLYKKCGFADEGKRTMGPSGELIVMSYYL